MINHNFSKDKVGVEPTGFGQNPSHSTLSPTSYQFKYTILCLNNFIIRELLHFKIPKDVTCDNSTTDNTIRTLYRLLFNKS